MPLDNVEFKYKRLHPYSSNTGHQPATHDGMGAASKHERQLMIEDIGHRFHSRCLTILDKVPSKGKTKAAILYMITNNLISAARFQTCWTSFQA